MKRVSFSIPSSSSSKRSKLTTLSPPSSPDQTKEYITEFDSSQTTVHESKNHLIIPPIPEKQVPNVTNNTSIVLDKYKAKKASTNAEEKPIACEGKGVGKNAERGEKDVEYKKGNNTRVRLGFVEDNGGEFQ
ncbi:hypothetical protein Tco_0117962 [Tanacetum coccineum]